MRRRLAAPDRSLNLQRGSRTPTWLSLLWRVLLVTALIGFALAVHWFNRDQLKDNTDGSISFVDVLYFTMMTVTTVGYGDIVPVTPEARLFDAFVLTPIRLFIWLIFLGTAYDFVFKSLWERWRMSVIQRNLCGHVVIAGFGASGREAFHELRRLKGDESKIVIIDCSEEALTEAEACGAAVLKGDATRDATLEAVRVAEARSVIVSAGRDDTSILIVLTARRLAPKTPISVVIEAHDNEVLARQAGADTVINPASFTGLLLAGSTHGQHIADYLSELAGTGGGATLAERPVRPEEVGRPLTEAGAGAALRLYRDGRPYGRRSPQAARLEAGDLIIEVVDAA